MTDTLDMFIEAKASPTHPLRLFVPKESVMATDATDHSLKSSAWTFAQFSTAVHLLAFELPNRVTIRQALVFAMIVEKVSMGHDVTIAELREEAGKDRGGDELLGQSIGRSYQVFLEPTKKEPENLGWAYVEEDEDDRRRKLLRLTPKGTEAALKIAKALKEKS